jgi:hypothetical protein
METHVFTAAMNAVSTVADAALVVIAWALFRLERRVLRIELRLKGESEG